MQLAQGQPVAEGQPAAAALPTLTLRPDMDVEVRQRAAPLGVEMDKYGNREVAGSHLVDIDRATFGSVALTTAQKLVDIEDWFAPAEYFDMSKNERLDAPSFEPMPAGKRLAIGGFAPGGALDCSLEHEYSVIDRDLDRKLARSPSPRKGRGRLPAEAAASRLAAKSSRAKRQGRFQAVALAVESQAEAWRVIDIGSAWRSAAVRSFTLARQLMNSRQRDLPHLQGRLRTIPVLEAAPVATGAAASTASAAAPALSTGTRPSGTQSGATQPPGATPSKSTQTATKPAAKKRSGRTPAVNKKDAK